MADLKLKSRESCKYDAASLGEVMMRLDPGDVPTAHARELRVWHGGGETNVAEVTFRIDDTIVREAMKELVKIRAGCPADRPFVLGVGSVINPGELDAAIEMGFDMIVAPANVMGGHGQGVEFARKRRQADVFCAPAILTPTELNYFLERPDGLEPDCVKESLDAFHTKFKW
ncbi:MAG: hypothetical protein QME60_03675 [Verrucomicrobiota bacterium]|nr:hypothetical protein [Verrucomicrobiota bacterium]